MTCAFGLRDVSSPLNMKKRKKEQEEKNEKGRDKNGLRTGRKDRRINRVI